MAKKASKKRSQENWPKRKRVSQKKILQAMIALPLPYDEKKADALLDSLGQVEVVEGGLSWTPNKEIPPGAKKLLQNSVKALNKLAKKDQISITPTGTTNEVTSRYTIAPPSPTKTKTTSREKIDVRFYWWGMKVTMPFSVICSLTTLNSLEQYTQICTLIPPPHNALIAVLVCAAALVLRALNNVSGGKGVVLYITYGGQLLASVPRGKGYHPCPSFWK